VNGNVAAKATKRTTTTPSANCFCPRDAGRVARRN
jgi:hypothetical protein